MQKSINNLNLENLRQKAEELKVIDVFNEIVEFLAEVKPIFEQVNLSITDNIRRIPGAKKKLSKVTEATEYATTDIMNTVDRIFQKLDKLSGKHKDFVGDILEDHKKNIELMHNVRNFLAENNANAQLLYDFDQFLENKDTEKPQHKLIPEKFHQVFTDIGDELNSIMISLQVQDITSQQIAAVNHLLEVVVAKLSRILATLGSKEISKVLSMKDEESNVTELHRKIAFDPNAVDALTSDNNRQDDVDDLIDKFGSGDLNEEDFDEEATTMSQEEIDALMNAGSAPPIEEEEDECNKEEDEEISQDDIDALFNNQ